MPAAQRWRRMVEEEHAQSERAQATRHSPTDHWAPYAAGFAADPYRTDDPLLDRLAQELAPSDSLLDVGAGGGRYALALAMKCSAVTAVEPSASMVAVLRQYSMIFRLGNVSVVESTWEDAQVDTADVVICVHVLYVARDIVSFLRKLEAHARRRVVLVMYQVTPQAHTFPVWEWVHGESRLSLPSVPQLLEVFQELGIAVHREVLPSQPSRAFDSPQRALEQLGQRLYVDPGSPKQRSLELALERYLEEADGAYRIKDAPRLEPNILWWEPRSSL